jgi:large subunit ribosomal protein L32e
MKILLELRRKLKAKKPNFRRADAHKKAKLGNAYRKPKGLQNKMRLSKKGYRKTIKVGYGSPRQVKDLTRDGLRQIRVCSMKDLLTVNPKTDGAELSRTLGMKKKLVLIAKALELKIKILNVKEPQKFIDEANKKVEDKKAKKVARDEKKKAKEKKKAEKTIESKVKESEAATEEETKVKEKKELDKTLISKE